MDKLINDLNSAFHKARIKGVPITHPSIPILFFGDLAKYRNSDLKVITVGLNPSHIEFPTHSRFTRFLDAESLDTSKKWSGPEVTTYLHSLSEYFKHNPYSWFDSFESILNGMHTSYYPNIEHNTALHTDLCSPFSTDITWSKLSVRYRNVLRSDGISIWHRLTARASFSFFPSALIVTLMPSASGKGKMKVENNNKNIVNLTIFFIFTGN